MRACCCRPSSPPRACSARRGCWRGTPSPRPGRQNPCRTCPMPRAAPHRRSRCPHPPSHVQARRLEVPLATGCRNSAAGPSKRQSSWNLMGVLCACATGNALASASAAGVHEGSFSWDSSWRLPNKNRRKGSHALAVQAMQQKRCPLSSALSGFCKGRRGTANHSSPKWCTQAWCFPQWCVRGGNGLGQIRRWGTAAAGYASIQKLAWHQKQGEHGLLGDGFLVRWPNLSLRKGTGANVAPFFLTAAPPGGRPLAVSKTPRWAFDPRMTEF